MRTSALTRRVLTTGLVAIALSSAGASSAQNDPPEVPGGDARGTEDGATRTYIVTMDDEPALTYSGGTAGIPATRPGTGQELATGSANVRNYRSYLRNQQDLALGRVGVPLDAKLYDYTVAVNGVAARLTGRQAANLQSQSGVVSVVPDEMRHLDTVTTPDFLGLTAEGGAWDQQHLGEDVVIGVIDSGIWPESASFCDTVDADGAPIAGGEPCRNGEELAYEDPAGWWGTCQTGERFGRQACNNKLVGARYYNEGFGGNDGISRQFPKEYNSPRDADGHGTHTAGIAAGNARVPATVAGEELGTSSGMAPRARVATYKACWGIDGSGGCYTSDAVAAIDDAVGDGVDVINYSISGTDSDLLDPVEAAFFNANSAGVFIAASAGNTGPAAGTVNHPSPWITTVAATTHNRVASGGVLLGNGDEHRGKTWQTSGTGDLPMVYGGDAAAEGADPLDAALCLPGTLDPEIIGGAMVLCDRGETARTHKSRVVANAGGEAMILANITRDTLNAETHAVPTVHISYEERDAILAYLRTADEPTGQLTPRNDVADDNAPELAMPSSRGPALATDDLLKPDLAAPGVDVIAPVAPPNNGGEAFSTRSGTSLSAAHVAGLAAVVKSSHPRWSPAVIKSALMTTAEPIARSNPLGAGSGQVDINDALEPGLVYDAGAADYVGFLCGTGQYVNPPQCDQLGIEPANLNQPNISVGALAGEQTITREVTNTGRRGTYQVDVQPPDGIDVQVSPTSLQLRRGERATYEVIVSRNDAPLDEWAFGTITWSDGTHDVASQLAVRPVALTAPDQVTASTAQGNGTFDIDLGYEGGYQATAHGMVPAATQEGTVANDPSSSINTALDSETGVTTHEIDVPPGTSFTRFSLFDTETDGDDDLDLYVFDPGLNFVGSSGNPTANETVDLENPTPGTYTVVVHGWHTDGPDAAYTLFDWSIPFDPSDPGANGALVVESAPESAGIGATGTVGYGWSGLEPGTRYLGLISHKEGPDEHAETLVSVTTK